MDAIPVQYAAGCVFPREENELISRRKIISFSESVENIG
jgi:hypothetical protein